MPGPVQSRALVKVYLTDLFNPGKNMEQGLLNPEALSYATSVSMGELSPVNWPHSILQYGGTKSTSLPLDFYFSDQLTPRAGGSAANLVHYTNWFESFCYPNDLGVAPPPLLILWPSVLEMAVVVESVNINFTRFHAEDLSAAAVHVRLSARELRHTFRTAARHRKDGRLLVDPLIERYQGVGSPLNFKGSR
jgi:hypothetical protein